MQLQVEFLRGGYFAADETGEAPEFPPHPNRLFAAMVGAVSCLDSGEKEAAQDILKRMEAQSPPTLYVGRPLQESPHNNTNRLIQYLPVAPKAQGREGFAVQLQGSKAMLVRPATYLEDPRMVVEFAEFEPSDSEAPVLDRLVQWVWKLGRGESLIDVTRGSFDLQGLTAYQPNDAKGTVCLKIPERGSFERLEEAYQRGKHYNDWGTHYYEASDVGPRSSSIWSDMHVLRLQGSVHVAQSLPLMEAMRSKMLSFEGSLTIPPVFHGHNLHGRTSHCALMPLPNVGTYGDGQIKGVALCTPRYSSQEDRSTVHFALDRLCKEGFHLQGEPLTVTHAKSELVTLRTSRWCRPSRKWVSVTPITLDRVPKKKMPLAKIIATMCEHIELPPPVEIRYIKTPLVKGSVASSQFRRQRKGKRPPLSCGHLEMTFQHPVQGPVLLGNLRHFGLGTFLPVGRA